VLRLGLLGDDELHAAVAAGVAELGAEGDGPHGRQARVARQRGQPRRGARRRPDARPHQRRYVLVNKPAQENVNVTSVRCEIALSAL